MDFETIDATIEGSVARVHLHESLVALSTRALSELEEMLDRLAPTSSPEIRAISLLASGPEQESDSLAGREQLFPDGEDIFDQKGKTLTRRFERLPVPVVAGVDDDAIGGGFELLLACDYIYATRDSSFGKSEVQIGVEPDFGGRKRLIRFAGADQTRDLLYTGRTLSASEAEELGIVNAVFDSHREMSRALRKSFGAITTNSAEAITVCKGVVNSLFSDVGESAA